MTQVKEMTNPELNRKLAELMGYMVHQENCYFYQLVNVAGEPVVGWYTQNPDDAWDMVPDYCTDPAASREVQAAACKEKFYWYIQALSKAVGADGYWDNGALDYEGITLLLTASPRERGQRRHTRH